MIRILTVLAILFAISLLGTGCTAKPSEAGTALAPHRTDVYFLIQNSPNCGLRAYVPEGSVCVSVQVGQDVTDPYVEVPRERKSNYRMGEGEFVVWGYGGTLFVKDVQQVKDLLLSVQGHD